MGSRGTVVATTRASNRHEATAAATTAVFVLEDTPETRAEWPHTFVLAYTVTLAARALRTALAVTHRGAATDAPFSFTAALHTYFAVERIGDVRVTGLHGLRYTDKMRAGAQAGRLAHGAPPPPPAASAPPVVVAARAGSHATVLPLSAARSAPSSPRSARR